MTGEGDGRLAQLSRAYAVVSAVRRVIVHAAGEKELFDRACRIAVEEGRFRFAWIGAVDRAASRVVPVASAGHDDGYLDHIRVDLGQTPYGRGPSGTAVHEGRPCVANDLARDLHVSPWRDAALARGYRSSAGFPVHRAGEVVAVLSLYSSEVNSFDPSEVALFGDLAVDIGLALDAIDAAERRRAAEERLRESEERYRTLVEQAEDAIFLTDESTRYIDANQAACKLLGYTREELCRMRIADVYDPSEVSTEFPERMRNLMRTGTVTGERRLRRKDGSLVSVELRGRRMASGQMQAIVRDITERKQLQAQLLLADRMASMGRLAAGTAHEINNPLAYVSLNLELVAKRLSKGEPLDERSRDDVLQAMERAREGAERVRQIVRALSSFSRGDETPVGAVDVDRALDAAIEVAAAKLRHRATVVRDYKATRPARANEFRLGQVLVNLLCNAADALAEDAPERNTITVRTYSERERVFVEIADTGVGIPAEVRDKIFDPFFTTKPVGTGTGLGLAVCHGIVTAYGGEISVESDAGLGARVRFWLPAADRPSQPAERAPESTSDFVGARVLVVDDEVAIGATIRNALGEHHVTVVQSAREALDLCAAAEFDCILSDVSMPGMSGLELYEAIAHAGKGLARRLVFITGGALGEPQRAALAALDAPCLEKPFSLAALADVVRKAARR
jgi:two-component system, cell cycle sensor histidine kinase and response regulator CckA